MYISKEMNEMQEKGYQVCKRIFADYIKWWRKHKETGYIYYKDIAEETLQQYHGACDLYEDVFEEEFILKPEDRKKILGPVGYGGSDSEEYEVVVRD